MITALIYYPLATATDPAGNKQELTTYEGMLSVDECKQQFELWRKEYGYKFTTAGVQVVKNGKVVDKRYFEYYKDEWLEID